MSNHNQFQAYKLKLLFFKKQKNEYLLIYIKLVSRLFLRQD